MMKTCSITSDLSEVKNLAHSLNEYCEAINLDPTITGQLELMLVEGVNNVIEHSYRYEGGFPIHAMFDETDTEIVLTITDYGSVVPETVKQAQGNMPEAEGLPEGGWGLALIQAFADRIEYRRGNGENTMVFAKNKMQ